MWFNRFSWLLAVILRRDTVLISDEDGQHWMRHVYWIEGFPYYRFQTSNLWRLRMGGVVSGPGVVRRWEVLTGRSLHDIGDWA